MKNNWIVVFLIFIWCIFMGITAISIGFGAIFPSMNLIAKPFVCRRGEMQLETQVYRPTPIETVTTLRWYCVDNTTGEKNELGLFPMSLYAGTIYGLLLFLVGYAGMKIWARMRPADKPLIQDALMQQAKRGRELSEEIRRNNARFENDIRRKSKAPVDALSRMKELKDMRDANLISEAEYEQKRAEILKEM